MDQQQELFSRFEAERAELLRRQQAEVSGPAASATRAFPAAAGTPSMGGTSRAFPAAAGAPPVEPTAVAGSTDLNTVLSRMRDDDLLKLEYPDENSKPSTFETWNQRIAIKISSMHPLIAEFWSAVQMAASLAYDQYLMLGPMQRGMVKPETATVRAEHMPIEMRLRPALLLALPQSVQTSSLGTKQVTVSELLFAAMVDAGPGTRRDRDQVHKAVSSAGASEVRETYAALQKWKFDLTRLLRLGMQPPDPTLQAETLRTMVKKMSEKDQAFQYRMHAYQMSSGMFGMVTQVQVDEFWKFLSAEAREVQGAKEEKGAKEPQGVDPDREGQCKGQGRKRRKGRQR